MTPSEAPKALQASECSELLDLMRASCWITAQHKPGKFTQYRASSRRLSSAPEGCESPPRSLSHAPLSVLHTAKVQCQGSTRDSWRGLVSTLGVIVASRSYPMPRPQEHFIALSVISPHVVTLQGMLLSAKCSAKATCETP